MQESSVTLLVCLNQDKLEEEKAFGKSSSGKLLCGKIISGRTWIGLKLYLAAGDGEILLRRMTSYCRLPLPERGLIRGSNMRFERVSTRKNPPLMFRETLQ